MPSDTEWTTLINDVGGEKVAGTKLKSTSGWKEDEKATNSGNNIYDSTTAEWKEHEKATNSSGFTALPGGTRNYDGKFSVYGGTGGMAGGWWGGVL